MPFAVTTLELEQDQETFFWRGYTREDIPEVFDLLQTVNRADDNDHAETVADLEREFVDPWSDPQDDARIIRNRRTTLVGFARAFVNPKPRHENVALVWSEIAPTARGQGLEEETLSWMEQRATTRLAKVARADEARNLPRLIRVSFPEMANKSIALYNARGYSQVCSFYRMQRALSEALPTNSLPEGFILRVYGEDIDEKLRQAFNEAFGEHWWHEEVSAAEWHPFVMDVSDVRKDLTLVVMDGEEVAAFSINRVKQLENEREGVKRAWIGSVGTRRPWRKRGIASALIAESMRRFRAEGFEYAALGVDAENLTGALALDVRLGFSRYKTRVVLERQVR